MRRTRPCNSKVVILVYYNPIMQVYMNKIFLFIQFLFLSNLKFKQYFPWFHSISVVHLNQNMFSTFSIRPSRGKKWKFTIVPSIFYRVIFDNLHQELTCYSLVLGLLRIFKELMWPQDWVQIAFESEIYSNWS